MNIRTHQAASGFRSHYMHVLVICKQKFTPVFAPPSQNGANRLNLVPLDDLELPYSRFYLRGPKFCELCERL